MTSSWKVMKKWSNLFPKWLQCEKRMQIKLGWILKHNYYQLHQGRTNKWQAFVKKPESLKTVWCGSVLTKLVLLVIYHRWPIERQKADPSIVLGPTTQEWPCQAVANYWDKRLKVNQTRLSCFQHSQQRTNWLTKSPLIPPPIRKHHGH